MSVVWNLELLTSIKGSQISLDKNALLSTQDSVFLEQIENHRQKITLSTAEVLIGAGSRVRASISAKRGAKVDIGKPTYINQGSEIRCHSAVSIGSCVLISYEVDIFDNNTHSIDWQNRRQSIEPSPVGSFIEQSQPANAPISIGNDCWIGKRAAILKGVSIGNRSIVALGSIVTKLVPEDCLAYGNPASWKENFSKNSLEPSNTVNTSNPGLLELSHSKRPNIA